MAYTPGRFVWRELMTSNPEAAAAFYTAVFGWTWRQIPMPSGPYWIVAIGPKEQHGMMALPKDAAGVPPMWGSYVSVSNVDAAAATAVANGGKVYAGPMDIPNVGRFATIADPEGAVTNAFKSLSGDELPAGPPPNGAICWESLQVADADKAKGFYQKLYGWQTGEGAGAPVFKVGPAMEDMVASVGPPPPGVPAHWMLYVATEKLTDSLAKVTAAGGKVLMAEIPVPGMGKFGVVQDPQGAVFGIFESAMPA